MFSTPVACQRGAAVPTWRHRLLKRGSANMSQHRRWVMDVEEQCVWADAGKEENTFAMKSSSEWKLGTNEDGPISGGLLKS
nr:hypothetical protein CFP56_39013 [Quercus suber]